MSAPQQESLNDAKPRIATVSQTINKPFNVGRISRNVVFVICGSCFWAASYLEGKTADRCQACESVNIDSLPVAGDEAYIYDYDTKRGIMMDFTHVRASK